MVQAAKKIPESEQNPDKDYREAPHNFEAEQLLLGAILSNNDLLIKVSDFLLPDHFYAPAHKKIYEAILIFTERGLYASPITLKTHMDTEPLLQELGGSSYLAKLAGMGGIVFAIRDHAEIVYECAMKRLLIDVGGEIINDAHTSRLEHSADDIIAQAESKLFTIATTGRNENDFAPLTKGLTDSVARAEYAQKFHDHVSGTPTGLLDLDKLLGGLHDSDLLILAARPSMGKTALAINVAYNAAKAFLTRHQNLDNPQPLKTVGFMSLEMSAEQLATRMLAMETDLSSSDIRRGRLDPKRGDMAKLIEGNNRLAELPFFIDDTPALSISAARTRARRLKRKHNLGLLVIDYLQLLRGVGRAGQENRVQEVSEITQGLKAIAKELNIPVLALSQLSRAVEQRDDKRPQLSDLRESGSIEQDADVVMFIFREAYYVERKKPAEDSEKFGEWQAEMEKVHNLAEIMVAKHRNGAIGNIQVFFDGMTTKFGNYEKQMVDFS